MQRILLLMAVLSPTIAPHSTFTASPTTEAITRYITMSSPPTVFRNPRVTTKPRRTHMRGKSDSPMLNYIFDSYATSNKHFHDNFRPPSFEDLTSEETILDADTGATVLFECKVTALRDKTVSWLRIFEDKNFELLTVNLDTHAADTRYRVDLAGENWKLTLADAKVQDSGVYCCHVSTHPPMLRRFKLTVNAPSIKMAKEAFLETGTTLSLKCLVLHLHPGDTEPVLHWFRGNTTTSLDEIRGGVLIETDHLTLTSHLQVARLKMDDAGNYTCALEAPIQMRAIARVHVLQGSSLAELQSGVKTTTSYLSLLLTTLLIVLGNWVNDVR